MIKSVFIQNFEAHAKTHLDFTDGVNVIGGSSNNGKSSIIKALMWCLFNQPSGFSFKKNNCRGATIVKIVFDNGQYIERKRDSKTNQYDCNGEILKALGTGVPEVVTDITNVSGINIQSQFDQFYLLQESSGEVARTLNDIVGLSVIDSALSKASKFVNSYRKDSVTQEKLSKTKKEELEQYSWVGGAEITCQTLKDMVEEVSVYEEDEKSLSKIIERHIVLEEALSKIPNIPYEKVEHVKSIIKDFLIVDKDLESLSKCIDKLDSIRQSLNELDTYDECGNVLEHAKKLVKEYKMASEYEFNLNKLISDYDRINNAYNDTANFLSCKPIYDSLREDIGEYEEISRSYADIDKKIRQDKEIQEATVKVMKIIERAREEKRKIEAEAEVCPLCGKTFENGECC
jgi:exonuclease SbcC